MESIEVGDDVGSAHGCSSEEYDCFVSENIFIRGWQTGKKKVFLCRIIGLCRSI